MNVISCICACVSDCNPELFESTLRLRERRLEVEDQIQEEMRSIDSLKKECDALAKKVREMHLIATSSITTLPFPVCLSFQPSSLGEDRAEQPQSSRGRYGAHQSRKAAEA